jgi:N-acetylglucosaminyldiphosphoundecaprenol N-acetyl-beta-D-mannosaminyltransferase
VSSFIQSAGLLADARDGIPSHSKDSEKLVAKYAQVLGVHVSAVDMTEALRITNDLILRPEPSYICVTGVHGVMEAQDAPQLMNALNCAAMTLPDGMPMTWVGHLQGQHQMDRVFGPDFMLQVCRLSVECGYRHFLYGGEPGVASDLKLALETKVPGVQIVGTFTPPFRPLTPDEEDELKAALAICKPHIMWIGISTPKQECFMAQHFSSLNVPLLVGVGAAFDYHTGRIRDCSPWIKRAGLQWLHRLSQDPRHLWRRYLKSNPRFLWKIALQLYGERIRRTKS